MGTHAGREMPSLVSGLPIARYALVQYAEESVVKVCQNHGHRIIPRAHRQSPQTGKGLPWQSASLLSAI